MYHLQLLIKLVLPKLLFELCPLSHLLHLSSLLSHSLPDQLALESLFLVLRTPPLLKQAVSVGFLSLAGFQVGLKLPESVI